MIVFEYDDAKCKILWRGSFAKCMRFVKEYIEENYENTVFKRYFNYNEYSAVRADEYTCFCERTDKFVNFKIYTNQVDISCELFVWYNDEKPKKETDLRPEFSVIMKNSLFRDKNLQFFDAMKLMKSVVEFAEEFGGEVNNSWYGEYCVLVDIDPYGNYDMDEWLEKNLPEEFDYEYVYHNGDEILPHVRFGFKNEASRYFSLNGVATLREDNLKYHVGKTAIVVYDEQFYYVWAIPFEGAINHRIDCPTAWFCRCPKPENFKELLKII